MDKNLMVPIRTRPNITEKERFFNRRISSVRRVIENVFGILVSRFRLFLKPMYVEPSSANFIVSAACVLHNCLNRRNGSNYLGRELSIRRSRYEDENDLDESIESNESSEYDEFQIRSRFVNYYWNKN